jgi:hypothetical protein
MIFFGWTSALLAKYLAHEVGLTNETTIVDYHIEIRQKYFHISGLPCFPMGKMLVLRSHQDNKLYELQPDALKIVQGYVKNIRTPWYTYIGVSLIGLLAISGIAIMLLEK